ncbi:cofactor-independent phosphoglycerate mutase [Gimesia maris]|uniref:Cofactor-independent phosphoglycerate mutase n=1 Tax=Gimesia maris TaxID=122 RepID=A0ABX5YWR3_9PLAN|nr:cofactor-independent phosphoglycerate mutase [Gimesia maris]EDL60976.1 cofactor-independent phosphoglycerate mutase [Gimesia maris DSM 8797]QDU18054.1 cofactor-independent phosphoglycerate mutase [Gimesia maris]QEG20092.1 cofactor-independent phosphoglycerate mutase [Gimesia maris]QGQ32434.1 cofactor-independent phosphoglycerate mutase [Gimesia maris]
MKYVLVIPDGCADEPQDALGGKTPLQSANVPHMDAVVAEGILGRTDTVPASMPSGSDVGTMSLFGYDPLVYHTGRAPLEAAAQGIELGPHDWAIRCNFVTIADGNMASFTASQLPNDVGAELVALLQEATAEEPQWEFHQGVSYRNLLIYRAKDADDRPFDTGTSTTPPHDLTDQPIEHDLPSGRGSELLLDLMERSKKLFTKSAENQKRTDGQPPATQIWLWGQGSRPALKPFLEQFNKTGAVITAVDLLRGLGRLLGWDVIEVEGATGYIDTDYAAKGRAAIETLKNTDFVVVHVEATDEASHEGEVEEKVKALENIDEHIVGPVHGYLKSQGDYRILVCPDHPTFLRTKTHSHGYVPFAICGKNVRPDQAGSYDEITAGASNLLLPKGHQLMPFFFGTSS